jgi:hypothetical protein
MRRFGDLEAVIMDRSWERDWPMLGREMVEDLRGRGAASQAAPYFSVGMVGAGGGPPAPVGHELHLLPFLRRSRIRSDGAGGALRAHLVGIRGQAGLTWRRRDNRGQARRGAESFRVLSGASREAGLRGNAVAQSRRGAVARWAATPHADPAARGKAGACRDANDA